MSYISYFDSSDAFDIIPNGSLVCPTIDAENAYKPSLNSLWPNNKNPHYSKDLPEKTDYERLSPYAAFWPHEFVWHILKQFTQIANSKDHYPMQRHLQSHFQMFRYKRLNEVITTDTYFSSVMSIKGHCFAQIFLESILDYFWFQAWKLNLNFLKSALR
jgi:hypothetical protein